MYKRGSIVLVPFPFSDLSNNKIRPAIVLSTDIKNRDVILVFITSKIHDKYTVFVPVTPTTRNCLKLPSIIVCDKIATLDKKVCLGQIGILEKETFAKVEVKIKKAMGL